jgi:hypothetical protein
LRVPVVSITWDSKSSKPFWVAGMGFITKLYPVPPVALTFSRAAAEAVAQQAATRWGRQNVKIEEVK